MILARYLYHGFTLRLGSIFALLLTLALARYLQRLLERNVGSQLGIDTLLPLLGLKIIGIVPELLTIAAFLGCLLTYARMARRQELLVMRCSGLGLRGQLRWSLGMGLFTALPVMVFSLHLAPWAQASSERLLQRHVADRLSMADVGPRRFHRIGRDAMYLEQRDAAARTGEGVYYYLAGDRRRGVITARRMRLEQDDHGGRWVVFEQGRRYLWQPGQLNHEITTFAYYRLRRPGPAAVAPPGDIEARPLLQLWRERGPRRDAELQRRLSLFIACLLLPSLALLLYAAPRPEEGGYLVMALGMAAFFAYWALLEVSHTLVARALLPAGLGLWGVHALFALGLGLLYRQRLARS